MKLYNKLNYFFLILLSITACEKKNSSNDDEIKESLNDKFDLSISIYPSGVPESTEYLFEITKTKIVMTDFDVLDKIVKQKDINKNEYLKIKESANRIKKLNFIEKKYEIISGGWEISISLNDDVIYNKKRHSKDTAQEEINELLDYLTKLLDTKIGIYQFIG